MASELKFIRLNQIRQNKVALRDVDRTDEDFVDLVNSVRNEGILSPISVRRKTDPADDKEFELVDGLQRFTASTEVGTGVLDVSVDASGVKQRTGKYVDVPGSDPVRQIGVIPALIVERDEADTLIAQIIGNAHRIETQPVQYAKAMVRYLGHNPTLTENELAIKVGKTPAWMSKTLRLVRLNATIKPLVDDGSIPLLNAYALADLPPDEQLPFLERAQTQKSEEFVAAVKSRVKEIRDAHRAGRGAPAAEFVPVKHFRKKPEVEAEAANPTVLPSLIRELDILKDVPKNAAGLLQAAVLGAQLGLNWMMNFDPKSIQIQKDKDKARKDEEAQTKIRRDAEKAQTKEADLKKKSDEAAAVAAKAREAAAAAGVSLEPAAAATA